MSDIANNQENPENEVIAPAADPADQTVAVSGAPEADVGKSPPQTGAVVARDKPVVQTPVAKRTSTSESPESGERVNPRKTREGIVVSDKMDMTLVVAVNERVSHPRYGKTVQRTKKLYVHDEKNDAKVGDRVRVQETRPMSKLKRWRLTEVVERAR